MNDNEKIWKQRPNVVFLSLATLFIGMFVTVSALFEITFSDYIHSYSSLLIGGTIIFSIPIFYNATRSTLKSDILDSEIIDEYKNKFKNFDNYSKDPLLHSVYRLYLQAADQKTYAAKNLAIGMGLTLVAVILFVSLIFTSRSSVVESLPMDVFLYTHLLPRIAGAVLIQFVASMFLRWYSLNVNRIGVLSDQIIYIEILMNTQSLAENDEKLKFVIIDKQLTNFNLSVLSSSENKLDRLDRSVIRAIAKNTNINISNES